MNIVIGMVNVQINRRAVTTNLTIYSHIVLNNFDNFSNSSLCFASYLTLVSLIFTIKLKFILMSFHLNRVFYHHDMTNLSALCFVSVSSVRPSVPLQFSFIKVGFVEVELQSSHYLHYKFPII